MFGLTLEHQSKNDRIMALRMATYLCLLYENLVQRKLIVGGRLPIVVPIVLYSGAKSWSAPLTTDVLIDPAPAPLKPYVLRMQYLLVNQRALVQSGKLPDNNLAALLFQLEHNQGIEDVQNLLQAVWHRTQGDEHAELRRAFTAWTKYVLLPRALPDVKVPQVGELLEIKDMLSDHSRSWTHQWKMEGRLEGQSLVLRRQLTSKFGPLSEAVQHRLQHATPAQLEAWTLNILGAVCVDDVFDD